MPLSLYTLIAILFFLVLFSAFFSGSEIGMMSLNRYRLRHLVKQKNKQAIRVNNLLSSPESLLSIILIGNTIANVLASMVATLLGQRLYGDLGVLVATSLLTLIILVFSEMAPKILAALYPEKVAFVTSLPLSILKIIFLPLVNLITWIAKRILYLFGVPLNQVKKESLSSDELRSVMHESGVLLPRAHKSMLISLLDLGQATVEDIMIPKSEIVGLDIDLPWSDLLEQLETAQHTRLPIFMGSIDNLKGVIHVRRALSLLLDDDLNLDSLLDAADSPYFIPEATSLHLQLLNFQKNKRRSCFVVDEYGDLQGLVTIEDILEEIVGEYTTDIAAMSKDFTAQDDGSVIVDATATLRQLNRVLKWDLPYLGPKTLNGLIIEYIGHIPPAHCCLQIKKYQMEILKVSGNTIRSVRIKYAK